MRGGEVFAGRFEVLSLLSSAGAQGIVYAVLDRSNGMRRALKTLPTHLAGEGRGEEFRREVQAGAAVESEHVAAVVDAGVDPGTRRPWVLMELLEGETLGDRLSRGALAPREFAAVFAQLGHGLMAAHARGVMHLDLKPSNVFLARSRHAGETVVAKLLDFGIARRVEASVTHVRLSQAIGTPDWMAPEQTGTGAVRASADVWALGLLAFNALTGRPYWRAQNDPSGRQNPMAVWEEILVSNARGMTPASARAAEYGAAGTVPPGFDAWFARCVAFDPSERFRDAGEAVPALLACVGTPSMVPVMAASASAVPMPPVPRWGRRLAVAAVMVVLVGAGAGVTLAVSSVPALPSQARPVVRELPTPADRETRPAAARVVAPRAAVAAPPASPAVTCPARAVRILAADFVMGAGSIQNDLRGQPPHRVRLSPYCIDRTEVTVAAFRAFWGSDYPPVQAARQYPLPPGSTTLSLAEPATSPACNWSRQPSTREAHPINCVNWLTATIYCGWLRGYLPSEAQWEYAARGGDARRYPWGEAPPSGRICGGRAAVEGTCPVGNFPAGASPFGALDMLGNVQEWTMDRYTRDPVAAGAAEVDPVLSDNAPTPVLRGSAWMTVPEDGAARRESLPAPSRVSTVGFRCAFPPIYPVQQGMSPRGREQPGAPR